jgi:hypothetical protein
MQREPSEKGDLDPWASQLSLSFDGNLESAIIAAVIDENSAKENQCDKMVNYHFQARRSIIKMNSISFRKDAHFVK